MDQWEEYCFMVHQVDSTISNYHLRSLKGNSKTRLVMAAASSRNLPLLSLTAADVYSAYVG